MRLHLALALRVTTAPPLLDVGVDVKEVHKCLGRQHIRTPPIYDKRRRTTPEGASHDMPICGPADTSC